MVFVLKSSLAPELPLPFHRTITVIAFSVLLVGVDGFGLISLKVLTALALMRLPGTHNLLNPGIEELHVPWSNAASSTGMPKG